MPYRVWIGDEAKAEIRRLPGHVRQRMRHLVRDLGEQPRPHSSRLLNTPEHAGVEVRRVRLGHWRAVYVIDEEWQELGILAVRRRPPYDYQDLAELLEEVE
jgi:mRNA-degrading endonuclease RelE of RelBE toxin-antitoxin system